MGSRVRVPSRPQRDLADVRFFNTKNQMEKVFVSGGTGYIALHCIKQLIEQGYLVKTSLRSLDKVDNLLKCLSRHVDCKEKLNFVN